MKILIVDDQPINRVILRHYLSEKNIETLEACDGVEASALLEKNNDVDIILLDLNMPILDGYGFLLKASLDSSTINNCKIIIISGTLEGEFYENANKFSIDTTLVKCYLNKPVDLDFLFTTIEYLLANG